MIEEAPAALASAETAVNWAAIGKLAVIGGIAYIAYRGIRAIFSGSQ